MQAKTHYLVAFILFSWYDDFIMEKKSKMPDESELTLIGRWSAHKNTGGARSKMGPKPPKPITMPLVPPPKKIPKPKRVPEDWD
jgi:hypothetical protein